MSTPLEAAEAEYHARLREKELSDALEAVNEAHEANPSPEAFAAHNRAQEELAAHRREMRLRNAPAGTGPAVGGDVTVTVDDAPAGDNGVAPEAPGVATADGSFKKVGE